MQKNKKVYMILTNGFDPDVRVYKEAKYLVRSGFDVTILCWDRKCEYQEDDEIEGIKIKRFLIPSVPGTGMKQLLPYMNFLMSIRKYLKKQEYEFLHCHDFDGIIVGMCTKNRKNKKVIFDMHEIYNSYAYAKNKIFGFVFNYVIKKSNYIVYVNEEQIKNIFCKEKLVYLPNYPEAQIYYPIEKIKSDKVRINYIGALRDYDSLYCLAQIAEKNDNYKIGLYGTGTSYNELKNKLNSSNVYMYGKYDGIKESGEIYRNTDILYCSYNPEVTNWKNAFPVKLYEAIITKTPIIVSDNTKVAEFVIEYGIGEVVEYNNQESLLNVINKISNNYNKYVEKIEIIVNEYKWERVLEDFQKIYGEVL